MSDQPISLRELLTKEFPPGNFIIGNKLLPSNGLMVIGGPPKSYKSFVSTTILYHLATGTNIFNAATFPHGFDRSGERMFEVPRPMRVLYLEQEIGFEDVKERLMVSLPHMPPEQAELFKANCFLHCRDMSMRLDRVDGCEYLSNLIGAVKPDVVCIDPLIEFHQRNENDASDMNMVFKNLDILREEHKFACILCHHTSKPSESPKSGADLLRGTSALYGKGDSFLMLSINNREAGRINVDFTIRRGKPINPMVIKLDFETLLISQLHSKEKESQSVSKKGHRGIVN